jgi:hypothetical protein
VTPEGFASAISGRLKERGRVYGREGAEDGTEEQRGTVSSLATRSEVGVVEQMDEDEGVQVVQNVKMAGGSGVGDCRHAVVPVHVSVAQGYRQIDGSWYIPYPCIWDVDRQEDRWALEHIV